MGIFGIKREEVKDIRRKRELESLKRRKKEEEDKRKLAEMKAKRDRILAEGSLYQAKAQRKQAKQKASFQWPILSTSKIKVKKKRQGRKLSSKKRITLI